MPLDAIHSWRIHLGAHKTATTHVQETLALIRPQLNARDVDFIPNAVLRTSGLAKALGARPVARRIPALRGRAVRGMMAAHVDPHRAGPRTMVLSEEKLLGGSRQVFLDPFYPAADRVTPMLSSLGDRADLMLFLSIRSLDTQLPSAYVQELKFGPAPEGGFAALKARVLARPPRWSDLVDRIRRAAPNARIRVWRQEDYRQNAAAILGALCGCEIGPVPEIADPAWTKSPGRAAVRAAEALPRDLPQDERHQRALDIFRAGWGGERFSPFTAAERAFLRTHYARDLERIAAADPAMLIGV